MFNSDTAGPATLMNSTVARNTASLGGGAYNGRGSTSRLVNSTISGNSSTGNGAGICNIGAMTVYNCTITDNRADSDADGDGIGGAVVNGTDSTFTATNSIIAGNMRGTGAVQDNIQGRTADGSRNIGDGSLNILGPGTGNMSDGVNGNRRFATAEELLLAPLGDYGGLTPTHALLPGSPALDAGDGALLPVDTLDLDGDGNIAEALPFDQRGPGYARILGPTVDIGAHEGGASVRVTKVYVGGTAWQLSFKQYLGESGSPVYGFAMPSAAGPVTLPWMNLNQISVVFSGDAQVDFADLSLAGVSVATYAFDGAAFAYDPVTHTATWRLPTGQAFGTDRLALALDGDAVGGTDFHLSFNILPGDVNRSGAVLADDFSAVKKKFFRSTTNVGTGDGAYDIFCDLDGNGSIVANDFSEVKKRFFNRLPDGQPTAAATFSAVVTPASGRAPTRPARRGVLDGAGRGLLA
jgi:hypothetical protein